MNLMFYGSSLNLSVMQYATGTNEPLFALNEIRDMLKGMVHRLKIYVNKQAIIRGQSFICAIVLLKLS